MSIEEIEEAFYLSENAERCIPYADWILNKYPSIAS
jgi:hypothetical protein